MTRDISASSAIIWEGIRVIEDVTDIAVYPGIETLEGRIGPLLKGDFSQAHFIEMQAGLFCEEHAHSTESLIFKSLIDKADDEGFIQYLKELKGILEKAHAGAEPFLIGKLSVDHLAIVFARGLTRKNEYCLQDLPTSRV